MKNFSLLLLILTFSISYTCAATWTGAVSNSWYDTDNWEGGQHPNAYEFVFVNPSSYGFPTIYATAEMAGLQVKAGAGIIIDDNATLNLNSLYYADPGILDNIGTINNYGLINITNASNDVESGITNEGTINNYSTGTIIVYRVPSVGLINWGTINNYNFIDMDWTIGNTESHHVIVNHGTINNYGTTGANPKIPVIQVEGGEGNGIINNGTFLNEGGIVTLGEETRNERRGLKINSGGTFTNRSLYNPSAPSSPLVALLRINRLSDANAIQAYPIEVNSGGTIINEGGEITIGDLNTPDGNVLFLMKGQLVNSNVTTNPSSPIIGTINLRRTNQSGMLVSGSFNNQGGVVNIGQVNSLSGWGLKCTGQTLTNSGTINIDNANRGLELLETGTIDNFGTINIGQNGGSLNIDDHGFYMNDVTSALNIYNGGELNIDNCLGRGFYAHTGSTISNAGKINIGKTGGHNNIRQEGFYVFATVTNHATGEFNIEHTKLAGMRISRTFTNDGTIRVSDTDGRGINFDHHLVVFTNNNTIHMGELGGFLTNAAIWFENGAEFYNECSGFIQMHSNHVIYHNNANNSTSYNKGIIIDNSTSESRIGANHGLIFNKNGGAFTLTSGNAVSWSGAIPSGKMWMGCSDGNWNNSSNWHGGVPGIGETAYVFPTLQDITVSSGNTVNAGEILLYENATLDNDGTLNIYQDLHIQSGATLKGEGTYNVEADWVNDGTFTPESSTVNMVGGNATEVRGTSETGFNLLYIDKDNNNVAVTAKTDFSTVEDLDVEGGHLVTEPSITLTLPAIYIRGNAKLTNDGHLNVASRIDLDGYITGDGIYETGGIFLTGFNVDFDETATSTFILSGANSAAFGTLTNHDIYKLVIDKDSPSTQVTQANYSFFCKEFELKSGTFVQQANLWADNVLINTDGTWNDCSLSLSGDLVNNGQLDGGNLNLNGETETEISGNAFTVGLLRTNKSGAGAESLISTDINVTNQVNFNNSYSGILNISSGSTVTLENGATIANESNGRYFTGQGTLQTTVSLNAPAGENPGNIGVEINSSANLGSTTIKRYHQQQTINGEESILRYYDISPANNSGLGATVKFHYHDHELNGWSESNLAAYRFNGSEWELYSATQNNTVQNYVETGSIDAFSIWTMASSSLLPVELTHFSARKDGKKVLVEWQTVSEINNEGFEIEHSTNGRNWEYIEFIKGQGTSTGKIDYSFLHEQPSSGMNYYRLRQVDFDGQWEYSETRSVKFSENDDLVRVFPNPASVQSNIMLPEDFGTAFIKVLNTKGQIIFEQQWEDGQNTYSIDLHTFESGLHLICIDVGGRKFTQKLNVISN